MVPSLHVLMGMLLLMHRVKIGGKLHVQMVQDLRLVQMAASLPVLILAVVQVVVAAAEVVVPRLTVCVVMDQSLSMMGIDPLSLVLEAGQSVMSQLSARGWKGKTIQRHEDG